MNFILFENKNGNISFAWENELNSLPPDTISFTYYQQNNTEIQSYEYRIGIPVKFMIGDMYIELDQNEVNNPKDDIYCLYLDGDKKSFQPMKKNTTLVNNFSELEQAFSTIAKKELVRKKK